MGYVRVELGVVDTLEECKVISSSTFKSTETLVWSFVSICRIFVINSLGIGSLTFLTP